MGGGGGGGSVNSRVKKKDVLAQGYKQRRHDLMNEGVCGGFQESRMKFGEQGGF